ncbi:tripartite tricarboxylate transporter TctB family protein [Nonomuraea phyllanthi]|uniref:tripartite tricarboxylate transporter TctB family protein n=1 Tax=Nonomuraea phyllanthi TaxID=2219224 RepID=UPI001293508A|nr:tripartite tricarboxylate transporter TctB family protein [Nonomuraea phyllanthi]QFY08527.1 tripartite tricarboxylate transporter TctB family protein [Nonomuraea phyllanthi]
MPITDPLEEEVAEETRPPHAGPVPQVVAALVALAVGVAGAIGSFGLGLGELTHPGPGLWPFAISIVIAVLSLTLVVTGRGLQDAERFSKATLLTAAGLVTLILLAALLPLIGFEIPSLLLVFVWLRWLGKESWQSSIVISIVTVAAFYLLFVLLLQVPLPRLI